MLRHKWLRSRLTNWLPERGAEDVLVPAPAKWQVRQHLQPDTGALVWGVWEPDADPVYDLPHISYQHHANAVGYANWRADW